MNQFRFVARAITFFFVLSVAILTFSVAVRAQDVTGVTDESTRIFLAPDEPVETGAAYPLVEEFNSEEGFTVTSGNVRFSSGWVVAQTSGDGEQYAYRSIPAFTGDVRLTVRGQVTSFANNCGVKAGIGDAPGNGVSVVYGFTGGGCPEYGPLVTTNGVQLNNGEDRCTFIGDWMWINQGVPYEATLTILDEDAELYVPDARPVSDSVTGTLTYEGGYSTLFVGTSGRNVSTPFCNVKIDSIRVEPLSASLFAIEDLAARAAYPTQIDLSWSHSTPDAAVTRIERAEDRRAWTEVATLSADTTAYQDNRVTCGMTYHYRANIFTTDGESTGYSNLATETTQDCATALAENWESGIRSDIWHSFGSPEPHVDAGAGRNGTAGMEPNGDGVFYSGLIRKEPIDVASGASVEFWMNGTGTIGQLFSSAGVFLTSLGPDEENEFSDFLVVGISGSTEGGAAAYQLRPADGLFEGHQEDWEPLDGAWHHYRFHIKPDGFIDFYRDGLLKHTSVQRLDFAKQGLLYLRLGGKSQTGDWHIDDLKVTIPDQSPWSVKVVDPVGQPVGGASVFAAGEPLGVTNQAGLINGEGLPSGTALTALAERDTESASRGAHDGWAYRTYLTNLDWRSGEAEQEYATDGGEQRLTLRRDYPLVLFNLVVSVEWNATAAYLLEIADAMRFASDYLLDLTDGQMAFGQVDIYSDGRHWTDADIQIAAKNIVHPHAYIGGIVSNDRSHVIRLGRGWDGGSGNQGKWDAEVGYRTIAHEFAHYGLFLHDEYYGYTFEGESISGSAQAFCPRPFEYLNIEDEATNASAMYTTYATTELSARGVAGMWADPCELTAQWQINGMSTWETIAEKFSDQSDSPAWQIATPMERGAVMAGPSAIPTSLPDFPSVRIYPGEEPQPATTLTVLNPDGTPYPNVIVSLYKMSTGRVLGQGLTTSSGTLELYGAAPNDIVRVVSFDGGHAGRGIIDGTGAMTLYLSPVQGVIKRAATSEPSQAIPHMRVIAAPNADGTQIDLLVAMLNYGQNADPSVVVSEPGSTVGHAPLMGYSPSLDTYTGRIAFTTTERGTGWVRSTGEVNESLLRLFSTYRLQRVTNDASQEVYSDDGNFRLEVLAGSLPAPVAYFVVMPPGAIPGPLPSGLTLYGDPYDVTASGSLAQLEETALLALHYDEQIQLSVAETLDIYRWNPADGEWQVLASELDVEQQALNTTTERLGVYALLGPPMEGPPPCEDCRLFVPAYEVQ